MLHTLSIKTSSRVELIDITYQIKKIVQDNNFVEGLACLFVPHTTAALTINEAADPSVKTDIIAKLNKMIPAREGYSHLEGNSDAHIKSSFFGPQLTIIVEDSNLVLGTWQGIYFTEFDGPRHRKLFLKMIEG